MARSLRRERASSASSSDAEFGSGRLAAGSRTRASTAASTGRAAYSETGRGPRSMA